MQNGLLRQSFVPGEITLHKAAKQHFDELGVKKLPTIKALNTEYAALMTEKTAAYAEYRKAREDMKELLTAQYRPHSGAGQGAGGNEGTTWKKRMSSVELAPFFSSLSRWI